MREIMDKDGTRRGWEDAAPSFFSSMERLTASLENRGRGREDTGEANPRREEPGRVEKRVVVCFTLIARRSIIAPSTLPGK